MHVLGLPPAFVLSQDQTLKLKVRCRTYLDVRTSAHPIRREPDGVSARCAPFQGNGVRRAVKLTLRSSAEAYGADMPRLDHRMDQAARTSLQSPSISKSVKKQEPADTAISQAPPAMHPRLRYLPAAGPVCVSTARRDVPSAHQRLWWDISRAMDHGLQGLF